MADPPAKVAKGSSPPLRALDRPCTAVSGYTRYAQLPLGFRVNQRPACAVVRPAARRWRGKYLRARV